MNKKTHKINQSTMANRLYRQKRSDNATLFRLFKVIHPVYEIDVNIEASACEDTYHIIEKYMDKLICGYTDDMERAAHKIYIKNKDELFSLLGIDADAYEIAESFFIDLRDSGHFIETPDGIIPKLPAVESIKLNKKVLERTQMEKKLFDVFSVRLMPVDFYELDLYCIRSENINKSEYAVWLPEGKAAFRTASDLENMINNSEYINKDRLELGLPQGYKKMSIRAENEISTIYFPYYIAVFRAGDEYIFEAYRIDNGAPIKRLTEMFNSSHYDAPRNLILSLCLREETKNSINLPHFNESIVIKSGNAVNKNDGFSKRERDGNYSWVVSDKQIGMMLGVFDNESASKGTCNRIANDDVLCLNHYDAGKLIFIKRTEEQRELILKCVSLEKDERIKLYEEYMRSKES